MDDFAYSRVENWLDKDFLFQAAVSLVKKAVTSSARVGAAIAVAVSAAQVCVPADGTARVVKYEISTASQAEAPYSSMDALANTFAGMDALVARLKAGKTAFENPEMAELAQVAATSVAKNETQSPTEWAHKLVGSIKFAA